MSFYSKHRNLWRLVILTGAPTDHRPREALLFDAFWCILLQWTTHTLAVFWKAEMIMMISFYGKRLFVLCNAIWLLPFVVPFRLCLSAERGFFFSEYQFKICVKSSLASGRVFIYVLVIESVASIASNKLKIYFAQIHRCVVSLNSEQWFGERRTDFHASN